MTQQWHPQSHHSLLGLDDRLMHTLYRFYTSAGDLLYVGITNNPARRFSKHRGEKAWWLDVARIDLEQFSSREAVAVAERQAIRNEGPRHNIRMNTRAPAPAILPVGPTWTYEALRTGSVRTGEQMGLWWEVDGSSMSDDFYYEEADEFELLSLWFDRHMPANDVYRLPSGHASIAWYVQSTTGFEAAPFCTVNELLRRERERDDFDFLSFFTWPINEQTGDPVNWLELPVLDKRWSDTTTNKGGFIQEALGWKPSPLQASVDIVRLAKAARVSL